MARKAVILLLLVVVLSLSLGCTTGYSTWDRTHLMRRPMIANEEVKLMQQDIDRFFGFEEYPVSGRYSH